MFVSIGDNVGGWGDGGKGDSRVGSDRAVVHEGPLFVLIGAHGKTGGAVIAAGEVGEAFAGVDEIPFLADGVE